MAGFWKNQKALITGASGFVGSHLTIRLIQQGAAVSVLNKRKISPASFLVKSGVVDRIKEVIAGDVTDVHFLDDVFRKRRFNCCFHLAAQPLVDVASADPTPSFEVNIKGTWNMLEMTRRHKFGGLLLISTAHVYGDHPSPCLEKFSPRPSRPYETSKACADMLAQTYANYYSLPIAIARCVNLYGPGDENTRLVPRTIQRLLDNQPPEIYADNVVRDYMYIDDGVRALMMLTEKIPALKRDSSNIIYNFGTGKHHSVSEVVRRITRLIGNPSIKPCLKGRRDQEIRQQYVSIAKARQRLGWRPQFSLDKGLRETIKWYKSRNRSGCQVHGSTVQGLEVYHVPHGLPPRGTGQAVSRGENA